MRFCLVLICFSAVLAGCAKTRPDISAGESRARSEATAAAEVGAAPILTRIGKVMRVNREARFVVVNFPSGDLPAVNQRLHVYRNGLKMGEVRASNWRRDENIVADIIAGDVTVNDEVRED